MRSLYPEAEVTIWLSSIYPGIYVTTDENEAVIDSNDLVAAKIEAFEQKQEQRRQKQIQKRLYDFIDLLEKDEEGNPRLSFDEEGNLLLPMDEEGNPLIPVDEDGNIILPTDDEGNPLLAFNEQGYVVAPGEEFSEGIIPEDDPEYDPDDPGAFLTGSASVPERSAEDIIAEANEEAERILADAQSQADAMRAHAEAEGQKQGYLEGQSQAIAELTSEKEKLAADRQAMEREFEQRQNEMERELVDVITEVVEKVFNARFTDCADIILHLTENALSNVTSSKEFLIKVNEANHTYLNEHREDLLSKVGSDVTLDVVADPLLGERECIIETDGGIFDCSMDVEMENLAETLRSLSI